MKPFIPPPLDLDTSPVSDDPEALTTITGKTQITPPQNPQGEPKMNAPKQPRLEGNTSTSTFGDKTVEGPDVRQRQKANKKRMLKKVDVIIALVEDLLRDMKLDVELDEEISDGEGSPDNGIVLGEDFTIDNATSSSSSASPADNDDIVEIDENGDVVEIVK